MGHPLPPGDLSNRRGLFLEQGRVPTDYRTVSEAHTRALSPILTEGRQRIAGEDPRDEISRVWISARLAQARSTPHSGQIITPVEERNPSRLQSPTSGKKIEVGIPLLEWGGTAGYKGFPSEG